MPNTPVPVRVIVVDDDEPSPVLRALEKDIEVKENFLSEQDFDMEGMRQLAKEIRSSR